MVAGQAPAEHDSTDLWDRTDWGRTPGVVIPVLDQMLDAPAGRPVTEGTNQLMCRILATGFALLAPAALVVATLAGSILFGLAVAGVFGLLALVTHQFLPALMAHADSLGR